MMDGQDEDVIITGSPIEPGTQDRSAFEIKGLTRSIR